MDTPPHQRPSTVNITTSTKKKHVRVNTLESQANTLYVDINDENKDPNLATQSLLSKVATTSKSRSFTEFQYDFAKKRREWLVPHKTDKYNDLLQKYKTITMVCEQLCKENEDMKDFSHRTQTNSEIVENENDKLKDENINLKSENIRCMEDLAKYVDMNDKYESMESENRNFKHNVSLLTDNVDSLQRKLANVCLTNNTLQQKLKKSVAKEHNFQFKLNNLLKECDSLQKQLKKENYKSDTLKKNLNKILKDNQTIVKQNNENIKKYNTMEIQNNNFQIQITHLNNRLFVANNEKSQIKKKLTQLSNEHNKMLLKSNPNLNINDTDDPNAKLLSLIDEKQLEINVLENRLESFQNKHQNCSDIAENFHQLQEKYTNLKNEYDTQLSQFKHLESIQLDLENTKENYASLTDEYNGLQITAKQQISEISQLRIKLRKLEETNASLDDSLSALKIEQNKLSTDLSVKSLELSDLLQQNQGLTHSISQTKSEYSDKLSQMSQNIDTLQNKCRQLSQTIQNKDGIYTELSLKYKKLYKEFQMIKEEKVQYAINLANHSKMKNVYEKEIDTLQNQLLKQTTLNNKYSKQIDGLSHTLTISESEHTLYLDRCSQLSEILNKLTISEETSEMSFKCVVCLKLYNKPVTCQPCGHSYCQRCIEKKDGKCQECSNLEVEYFFNEILDDLTKKYKQRQNCIIPMLKKLSDRRIEFTKPKLINFNNAFDKTSISVAEIPQNHSSNQINRQNHANQVAKSNSTPTLGTISETDSFQK